VEVTVDEADSVVVDAVGQDHDTATVSVTVSDR
jgi:hypothetical protein